MSTTTKLTYLDNTKNLLKNRLNSLGAEITSSTTFRNYLTWLDTFYVEVSDKTDLSVNGVVGRTSQSGAPTPDSPQTINSLTGNAAYKITTQNGEQTFTIPLGDIELGKITTYEDKIYSSNGKFYLEKNIGKHTFTANDNVQKASSSTDGYARCGWGTSSEIATADFSKIQVVCNKFEGVSQNDNGTSKTGIHWICSLSNTGDYKIMFRCGNNDYTKETFPGFIKNNNITVYYPLKTQTNTEITTTNYPELYSALKEIQDYLTSYKINKEFILEYSSPTIDY